MHTIRPPAGQGSSSSQGSNHPSPRQRRKPGRVPVSCAECRRLKLRCDRKVPCETCTKRGCAAICPNGTLQRRTNRLAGSVSANLEQLHAAQIERLTRRIRELERGLDEVYSTISDEKHPLLRDDSMLASGSSESTPPGYAPPSPMRQDSPVHRDNIINYLGTLNIGPKGDSCFYGATARGEVSVVLP